MRYLVIAMFFNFNTNTSFLNSFFRYLYVFEGGESFFIIK